MLHITQMSDSAKSACGLLLSNDVRVTRIGKASCAICLNEIEALANEVLRQVAEAKLLIV